MMSCFLPLHHHVLVPRLCPQKPAGLRLASSCSGLRRRSMSLPTYIPFTPPYRPHADQGHAYIPRSNSPSPSLTPSAEPVATFEKTAAATLLVQDVMRTKSRSPSTMASPSTVISSTYRPTPRSPSSTHASHHPSPNACTSHPPSPPVLLLLSSLRPPPSCVHPSAVGA
ncbi:hypothetical protein FA13DRAFT_297355 [Coprinellus micaceus]|uniref:Uncharacterized protein n=1 Tax=Coprinellus micaceus TaxID=71717 RepID=A0A4Y7SEQ4_COPMI|nr:hypothetical protein FA13DRAFT_297355 [Coprinellus micaceus]